MNSMAQTYFNFIKKAVLGPCDLNYSELTVEQESTEYGASSFTLNNKKILFRVAKITPTKVGQFVTVWKRNQEKITEPFSDQNNIDFLMVCTKKDDQLGLFVFPKSILLQKGIFSKNGTGGKRGFRLYPSWDVTTNKQAQKTQQWQLSYFITISEGKAVDFKQVKRLIQL
jgi:hypothetical protein